MHAFRPLCLVAVVLFARLALANASGAIGYSGAAGGQNCNLCHAGGPEPQVRLTGPSTLGAGATATYTLTVSGGTRAGMNVAVSDKLAALNATGPDVGAAFGELYQTAPKTSGTFTFSLSAPPYAGSLTLYAAGNAVNGNGATNGDRAGVTTMHIAVTAGSGVAAPVVVTPASAAATPVRARSTTVSVTAQDDGGEANLTYTWSATGPGPVAFSPNGSNAAKTAAVTFAQAGTYTVLVTVRDGTGKTVSSTVSVPVESVLTGLRLVPTAVRLNRNAQQQFSVSARDQFEVPLAVQPAVSWAVPGGGGTITASGLFKAQGSAGGPFVVQASGGGLSTSATVTVEVDLPRSPDTVAPTVSLLSPEAGVALASGLVLEAVAADEFGIANVTFTVAEIPVASVDAPPYRVSYVLKPTLPGGAQNLLAVATDFNGNIAKSSAVLVTVPMAQATGGGAEGQGGGTAGAGGAGGGSEMPSGCGCTGATAAYGPVALGALMLALWRSATRRPARARNRCGWSPPRARPRG